MILGHARHGKDTVAEILRDNHGFTFASSSLWAAEQAVRPALAAKGIVYASLEECYADRVNHRKFWYDTISEYNGYGASRLAEEILVEHDVYVGMRSLREYHASIKLFDYVLWVDASERGVPLEPASSMDIPFDPSAMLKVDNNSDLYGLEEEISALVDDCGW